MGTRSRIFQNPLVYRDHPHAYGDKFCVNIIIPFKIGSSPRVWGQASAIKLSVMASRIIPTRMGTSQGVLKNFFKSRDHPHAYGDKFRLSRVYRSLVGSSPRVWGQVDGKSKTTFEKRIIPTRMGTRSLRICQGVLKKDHPHAYGDKKFTDLSRGFEKGSSPRVWGQVCLSFPYIISQGIIPTRMGTRDFSKLFIVPL